MLPMRETARTKALKWEVLKQLSKMLCGCLGGAEYIVEDQTQSSPMPILWTELTMVVELVLNSEVGNVPVMVYSETGKEKSALESKMLLITRDTWKRRQIQENRGILESFR